MKSAESKSTRLKIAYLCESNPDKAYLHSGGNTRMFNTLQKHVGDVTYIGVGDSWGPVDFVRRLIHKMPLPIILRLRFRVQWLLSSIIAFEIKKQLKKEKYDVLFCTYGFFCLSNLKTPYPMVVAFTSDASFTAYKYSEVGEKFGSFFSLSRLFDPLLKRAEEKVYHAVDLLLWPSKWIRSSAQEIYGLTEEQSHLVPWGANVLPLAREELFLDNNFDKKIELLLVGRDWFPKGGPVVYEVLKLLLERGIDAHLSVVGCVPPNEHTHENMTVYPQLNKEIPEEYEQFTSLYKQAHFFVMPSYEAYGFAFCEASAYGLPALCLDVGGVPIKEGINGHALPKGASAADFADKIAEYLTDYPSYRALRETTREYYEEYLNWDAWGKKVGELIKSKQNKS